MSLDDADPDYLSLFSGDPAQAQSQAALLAQAIRQRRAAGTLGLVTGDPAMGAVGREMTGDADKMEQTLIGAAQHRATQGLQEQHYQTEQARQQAQEEYWKAMAGARGVEAGAKATAASMKPGENIVSHDMWGNPVVVKKYGAAGGAALPGATAAAGGGGSSPSGSSGPGFGPVPLTGPALDQAAEAFYTTGKLVGGMGKANAALNMRIRNRAAELHPDANLAGNQAGFGADSASLKKLQTTADALGAFEGTGLKNLQAFIDASKQIPDTGVPFLNRPARVFAQQFAGDPSMASFNAAHAAVSNEFAKILSGSSGQGALSDSARTEAAGMLPKDATIPQLVAAAQMLVTDAHNRRTATDAQLAVARARAGGRAPPATPSASLSPKDQAAIQWAKAHPDDPRAAEIVQRTGGSK